VGCLPYHGIPWYKPWYTMVHHGNTMVYHGILWYDRDVLWHGRTVVYHGIVHHGIIPWYTMVNHGTPQFTMLTPRYSIARHTMFAGDLRTLTAVARLPLHQLDYLVVNWSIHVTQIDRQSWADMWLQRNKNTAVVAIIGLCIQQLCGGSSHWLEDTSYDEQ